MPAKRVDLNFFIYKAFLLPETDEPRKGRWVCAALRSLSLVRTNSLNAGRLLVGLADQPKYTPASSLSTLKDSAWA